MTNFIKMLRYFLIEPSLTWARAHKKAKQTTLLKMKTSIIQLITEVNLADFKPKLEPVGENEKVIGEMSEDLKKVYALSVKTNETANSLMRDIVTKITEHKKLHDAGGSCNDVCKAHVAEIEKMTKELATAKQITHQFELLFGISAEIEFPELANVNAIGVRESFKIVSEDDERSNISPLLANLTLASLGIR